MGTVFGKQLKWDQIVGCSTIFSYKAIQTPINTRRTRLRKKRREPFAPSTSF